MIAGIDFSTHAIDVVLLDEDTDAATWQRFPLELGGDGFERARRVRSVMPFRGWWEDQGVVAVGIEDPRGFNAGALYRIQGGILQCLPDRVLVQPWIPSQWRKACGLSGGCSKSAVRAWTLTTRTGRSTAAWPQDACDALGIAWATRSVLAREATNGVREEAA